MKTKDSSILSKIEYDFVIIVLSFMILDMQAKSCICQRHRITDIWDLVPLITDKSENVARFLKEFLSSAY